MAHAHRWQATRIACTADPVGWPGGAPLVSDEARKYTKITGETHPLKDLAKHPLKQLISRVHQMVVIEIQRPAFQ